jgi:twitching motility two-component system response regulator PilG
MPIPAVHQMQGNLNDIDVRSLLQLIELNQRTGELFIETGDSRFWSLFCQKGRLVYATSSTGAIDRLKQCAGRLGVADQAFNIVPLNAPASAPEYGLLAAMVESAQMSALQAQQVIRVSTEEILFELLDLKAGPFIFEDTEGIVPLLITIELGKLLSEIERRRSEWQKLQPLVVSIEQRPIILDHEQLQKQLPPAVYAQMQQYMTGEWSLKQLGRLLGRDVTTVARAIAPYIQQGWMRLDGGLPPVSSPATATARIQRVACVDDSISIQKSVEFFLQGRGYEVRTIANPLKALNELFSFKPDLILLDIAMPRLDGYEVCGMLRKSNIFRSTPVIMLTGKDGFVDRVRARMAGATEYLTKPFGERELLDIVDKYLIPQAALFTSPRP